MKTTLNIPKDLIDEAMRASKKKTKTETIVVALKEYIRQRRLEEIIEEAGMLEFSDDWEKLRHER
ncbi:MAG TPA: type II toxin-antitoxin system VapB family antitoxin [Syntrophaceae bacterium]|nr:type II toxin-antitoxin system VapB family antitoxin [Syntrophaceae bacterium]